MNKNLFKSFAVAALSILAVGCAKEQVATDGQTVEATFNVDVPAEISTKAIGDGSSVNELLYQVFDKDGKVLEKFPISSVEMTGKRAHVSFKLVKDQTYKFVFWAQVKDNSFYTASNGNLKNISVSYSNSAANDESRDAFYSAIERTISGPIQETVKLTRPFAQLNIATDNDDANAAKEAGVEITKSSVVVKNLPNTLSTIDGSVSGAVDATFSAADVPGGIITVSDKSYLHLSMNYVLAPEQRTVYDITAELIGGASPVKLSVPATPFQRNYRTNIVGNLLTNSADFNVVVDPEFGGDENIDIISTETDLKALFANGGSGRLTGDVELSETVSVPAGKEVVLDLNGKSIENACKNNAIDVYGSLVINGEGTVDGGKGGNNKAVLVGNGGKLVVNSGTFTVGPDDKNEGNSCIETWGGDIEIYGGYFRTDVNWNGWYYVLNQKNDQPGTIKVYGGQFENYNPENGDDKLGGNFLAEGYRSVKTTYNGKQAWKVEKIPVVTTQEDLESALSSVAAGETATVYLGEGEFTLCNNSSQTTVAQKKTLLFVGQGIDKTSYVIGDGKSVGSDGYCDYSVRESDVTFKNMTIKMYSMTQNYQGFAYAKNLRFENCRLEGRMSYLGEGNAIFIGCTFVQTEADYNLTTWSGINIMFDKCVFKSKNGKFLNVYREQKDFDIIVKDCQFNAETANKSALELKGDYNYKYNVKFEGTNKGQNLVTSTTTGSELFNSNKRKEGDQTLVGQQETASTVYIDGKKVWENGAKAE